MFNISSSIATRLWVIPRQVVQELLQKDAHRGDARLLKQRAQDDIVAILKAYYSAAPRRSTRDGLGMALPWPYGLR